MKKLCLRLLAVLAVVAQPAMAAVEVGTSVGISVGQFVGQDVGTALPPGLGGMALITGFSLIIGIQLAKRRRK